MAFRILPEEAIKAMKALEEKEQTSVRQIKGCPDAEDFGIPSSDAVFEVKFSDLCSYF